MEVEPRSQACTFPAAVQFSASAASCVRWCVCWPARPCGRVSCGRPSTGVNEASSAAGSTRGLQAAALIRLLSPRQRLRVRASGQGCLISRTLVHSDPVPSGGPGLARPLGRPTPLCRCLSTFLPHRPEWPLLTSDPLAQALAGFQQWGVETSGTPSLMGPQV